jgi:hypothetical protein
MAGGQAAAETVTDSSCQPLTERHAADPPGAGAVPESERSARFDAYHRIFKRGVDL